MGVFQSLSVVALRQLVGGAGTPDRLRIRMRAQAFLLDFLKAGPRNTRDIWEAAQAHRFSRATLDRARLSLEIMTTRVHIGKPEQTNYWVLPTQEFTAEISDTPTLDEQLRRMQEAWPPRTPLDEETPRPI